MGREEDISGAEEGAATVAVERVVTEWAMVGSEDGEGVATGAVVVKGAVVTDEVTEEEAGGVRGAVGATRGLRGATGEGAAERAAD